MIQNKSLNKDALTNKMGIQYLNRILRTYAPDGIKQISLYSLKFKTIAVDTSIYLYRYQAENCLIENIYLMISLFKYYKITPIFVFDGKPPPEKQELLEKRKIQKEKSKLKCLELEEKLKENIHDQDKINEIQEEIDREKKKCVKVSKSDVAEVKELMKAYGVQFIEAEGEADQLCAKLVQKKIAYGCLSEDMDLFVYGTSRVFRYFSLINSNLVVYNLKTILQQLNLNLKEFKQICVLSGTDYNNSSDIHCNLYKSLKLFGKFKKSKEIDFYEWLKKDKKGIDYESLINTFHMFDISHVYIKHIVNKKLCEDKVALKEILKNNGFIFLNPQKSS